MVDDRQRVPGIARADQPPVHGDRDILTADHGSRRAACSGNRLTDEALDGAFIDETCRQIATSFEPSLVVQPVRPSASSVQSVAVYKLPAEIRVCRKESRSPCTGG